MKTRHLLFVIAIFVLTFTVACGGGTEPTAAPADPISDTPTEVAIEEPAT